MSEIIDDLNNNFEKEIIKLILLLDDEGINFLSTIKTVCKNLQSMTDFDESEKALSYSDFESIKNAWYKYAKSTNSKSLAAFHNSLSLGQTSSFEEKNSVSLSTVHTMKGQENDIVFLIGLDDLTFPDYRAVREGGFQLQQEKNDLYVAITRAKRFLYITYPTERTMPWGSVSYRNKSRFLPKEK
ncbi:3'-5' exonuclease [uncultured Treponema sp.]|uniref:3'-5' exonuclease n=1 Tax=uncultured Treponema sp. TaxID=162155 RepID=UPI0025FD5B78|nr:3'-5' exonuclease [uncultured Treponema sp.]